MNEECQTNLLNWSLTDRILFHRYRYYVMCSPVISDREYDLLERMLPDKEREKLGVGSDSAHHYPSRIAAAAEKYDS